MSKLTLKELTTPLTRKDVEASIYKTLAALEVPVTSWKSGGVARAITTSFSLVIAALSELIASVTKSGFLDTAEGPWLTILAKQTFAVDRIKATYATGEVTLSNSAGGYFALDPGDLIVRNARTDKIYVNLEPIVVPPLAADIKVKIRAQERGAGSSARPGDITEFVTPLNGVTCWNHSSVVAFDEEGDDDLRERCREYMSALSPFGPKEAYSYWAKTAAREGVNLGITRVKVERLSDYGEVGVTVATAFGEVESGNLAYLAEVLREKAVPLGVRMYLESATTRDIDISYRLWVRPSSSMTDAEVKAVVRQRLDALAYRSPIGGEVLSEGDPGHLFRDAIIEAIRSASPDEIVRVIVDTPTGDIELTEKEIPVLANVDATITRAG